MSRKLVINRLDKDELSYELSVRGIGTGSVDEMRRRLSVALQLERSGDSLRYPKYPFTFIEDTEAVKKKLEELSQMVSAFDDSKKSGEALKIQSKFAHVLGRLDNMDTEVKEELEAKSGLLARALSSMDEFNAKLEAHEEKNRAVPAFVEVAERRLDPDTFRDGIANASRSSAIDEVTRPTASGVCKSTPPSKWNIKFTGNLRDMSLSAFLEQIEELRVARCVPKGTLLDSGIDLFSGKALSFYQDVRQHVTSWDELIEEFKLEFKGSRYDEELLKEIEKRTQAKDESIGIYLAIMNNYFHRLTYPLSEKIKLSILLRNIRPSLQQGIGLHEISSIAELRAICRRLGERTENIENFHEPPPRKATTLEPDLAYVDEFSQASTSTDRSKTPTDRRPSEVICFRCRKPGHKAVDCKLPKKIQCFGCGKDGFTVRTCPDCPKSGNTQQRSQEVETGALPETSRPAA